MGEGLSLVTEVALGMIALTIGGEFYWVKLKRLGSAIVIVTVVQLFAAFLAVSITLTLLKLPLPFALLLGAIASATAPAATVAIVPEPPRPGNVRGLPPTAWSPWTTPAR
jgi:Kef-type K+ transport system membrane component KefB